jgi:hypothetical protein
MKISTVTKKFILFGIFAAAIMVIAPQILMASGGKEPIPGGYHPGAPVFQGEITGEFLLAECGVLLTGVLVAPDGTELDLSDGPPFIYPIDATSFGNNCEAAFQSLNAQAISGYNYGLNARLMAARNFTFTGATTFTATVVAATLVLK